MVSIITYDPLWDTMRRKGITTYSLIKDYFLQQGDIGFFETKPEYLNRNTE